MGLSGTERDTVGHFQSQWESLRECAWEISVVLRCRKEGGKEARRDPLIGMGIGCKSRQIEEPTTPQEGQRCAKMCRCHGGLGQVQVEHGDARRKETNSNVNKVTTVSCVKENELQ